MTSDPPTACSVCGEPTTNKCGGCKTRIYCSRVCQTNDWQKHRTLCKDLQLEKTLAQVAEIFQTAYFTFRENTFDTPINKIEDRADELVIYDGDQKLNTGNFVDFPREHISNERVRMAVLSAWTCEEPIAYMHELVKKLLQGLPIKVEEVNVSLKAIVRKTTAVMPNGQRQSNWPNFSHSMLLLTSIKTGQQWSIDISGGQVGIYQSFWKWEEYKAKFVQNVIASYPSSTLKTLINKLSKISGTPALAYGLPGEAAAKLDKSVEQWEKQHMNLAKLVALEHQDFELQKRDLLKSMDDAVRHFVKNNDFTQRVKVEKTYEAAHPGVSQHECFTMFGWLDTVNLQAH